jgi:hypothetical protein
VDLQQSYKHRVAVMEMGNLEEEIVEITIQAEAMTKQKENIRARVEGMISMMTVITIATIEMIATVIIHIVIMTVIQDVIIQDTIIVKDM